MQRAQRIHRPDDFTTNFQFTSSFCGDASGVVVKIEKCVSDK